MIERKVQIDSLEQATALFGTLDGNIKIVEQLFGVNCINRDSGLNAGTCIIISGENSEMTDKAARVISFLKKSANIQGSVPSQTVEYVCKMFLEDRDSELDGYDEDCVCITLKGKPIKPKTVGQKKYVDSIKSNTIILGIGPAGTGKTYLAVASAVTALRSKRVSRIILTRPAVEAGEKLGYLPGDLQSKINPYLRPLHDALFEMLGSESYTKLSDRGTIEIAPLAYMRGRTLDEAFIILDEAQNTTKEQMKMLLTRLGNNSKIVVTGDITQVDLPRGTTSGLIEASKVLSGVNDIVVHYFTERDVVRHKLVQQIILAYEKYERKKTIKSENKTQAKTK